MEISLETSVRTEKVTRLSGSQTSGCLRDGDSSEDVCTKLSDWGISVVSIFVCNEF